MSESGGNVVGVSSAESVSSCPHCGGTGWYAYDRNHSKVCEHCCDHAAGWWELTEFHSGFVLGSDNRCCMKGCGALLRDLQS